jgi:hypothetical protein
MVKGNSRFGRLSVLTQQFTNKFFHLVRKEGLGVAFKKINSRLYTNLGLGKYFNKDYSRLANIYKELNDLYKSNHIKGICILTSALEFDELYNQRTINLAKYLADKGYGVLFVTWQWEENQVLEKEYQKVYNNIYEVPMYHFIYGNKILSDLKNIENKMFISTLPAKVFYRMIPFLKELNFKIIYDILDEWEEFFKVGQASWFEKSIEESFVKESDYIFTVSEPLKKKFSEIKNEILVVGNGYNPHLSRKEDISLKVPAADGRIHIGYFGHLTESWFDWNLILDLITNDNFTIHLIGHGAPIERLDEFRGNNNAVYYGKIHPSELHEIVQKWHIGIIPFKHSNLSEAVDPIKIYEYLFFGLPTVSTGIPHIGNYPLVTHCESYKEVREGINTYYQDVISNVNGDLELKNFLAYTTWEKRFDKILETIS